MPLVPQNNGNEFRRQAVNKMKEDMKAMREKTQKRLVSNKRILKILDGIGFTSTSATALLSVTGAGLAIGAILPPALPLTVLSGILATTATIFLGISKKRKKKISKLREKLVSVNKTILQLDGLISKALTDEKFDDKDFEMILKLHEKFVEFTNDTKI